MEVNTKIACRLSHSLLRQKVVLGEALQWNKGCRHLDNCPFRIDSQDSKQIIILEYNGDSRVLQFLSGYVMMRTMRKAGCEDVATRSSFLGSAPIVL
mmetsp:Transcript_6609/g.24723  ORF Transcript_6609/g.24723 Transcript_6609/m.24723 type:complete len:97 (-) Transcript_6609:27-317(-)